MRGYDGNVQTGLSASNDQVEFQLVGGLYQIHAVGTWGGGSATLEQKAADNSTWLTVSDPITANGGQTLYLPAGTFRWTIVTATDVTTGVGIVPGE